MVFGENQSLPMPKRIVSLMPSQTEMIFALGAADRVVGVSDYCSWPPQVASLPRVGALELNFERLAMLKPDLVVDLNGAHARFKPQFERLGIPLRDYRIDRLEDIPSAAVALAHDLGNPEQGRVFVSSWNEQMNAISPASPSRRVYIEVWDTPPQAAGGSSFVGELLSRAGGVNAFEHAGTLFPLVDSETVVAFDPELILLVYRNSDPTTIGRRSGWKNVTAIRRNAIASLDPDLFVRPGPRCIVAIRHLIDVLSQRN